MSDQNLCERTKLLAQMAATLATNIAITNPVTRAHELLDGVVCCLDRIDTCKADAEKARVAEAEKQAEDKKKHEAAMKLATEKAKSMAATA